MGWSGSKMWRVPLGAAALVAFYGALVRPRLLTWGATRDEATRTYPGDRLVPDADGCSTMAATLPGPPEEVWPWLVQMGTDRAGWYSWDRLDNGGRPSADRIVPAWQGLEQGQRVTVVPGGETWFTVAVLVPNRTLVLRAELDLRSGRSMPARPGQPAWAYADSVWGFHLEPAPGNMTRLVVRTRGHSRPRPLTRPLDFLVWEPVHAIMQARQFHNLRERVAARPLPVVPA